MTDFLIVMGASIYFLIGFTTMAGGLVVRQTLKKVAELPARSLKTDAQREAQAKLLKNYESVQRKLLIMSILSVPLWPGFMVVNLVRKALAK